MKPGPVAIASCVLALLAAISSAQGLGDTAAREKAKREKRRAGTARVITNQDLESGRPPGWKPESGTATSSPSPAPEASSEGDSSESESSRSPFEDRNAALRPYLDAVTQAQSRLGETETRIRELQGKLNPMSTTFIYGEFNDTGTDKAAEEAQVRSELTEAEGRLAEAKQALAAAQQALDDFQRGRSSEPSSTPRD
jgi:hypothetical protein